MRRRNQVWLIVENKHGEFAALRGGRAVTTGMSSLEMAKLIVRNNKQPDERVWLVEPDGYRTEITKSLGRSGVR